MNERMGSQFKKRDTADGHHCRFTMPMSLASTPCCIVPCGFTDDGMPTALQIAAKPYDEATALQVGFAYEQSTDWHTKRPSIGQ
jgi:aspartyl-tRNA(Asn)/glutamyl-tRNA(Gln) amidotransferase subunit A